MTGDGSFYGLLTRRLGDARLAAALPYVPAGGRILDVGCGLTDLPILFDAYVGCDRNPDVLDAQREKFPER